MAASCLLLALSPTAGGLVQSALFDRLGITPGIWLTFIYSAALIGVVFVPSVMLFAMFAIWWERKVAAHIQSRIGPNRVGPIGLLQSLADGIKLVTKEDLTPGEADRPLFKLAAYLVFAPVFAAFLALPFGPDLTFEPRLSVGVFWILAVLGVEVMGVILAGWASNNKWSVYGAMREACQLVSYEVPLGIAILIGTMSAGTLNLVQLGFMQAGGIHTWLVFRNPFMLLAFVVYFVASLASNKRAPFDLPEADSELVAGYHTEYSGLRFAMFFFAEYAAMFVVGAVQVALFLGGWNDPFGAIGWAYQRFAPSTATLFLINLAAAGVFIVKVLGIVFAQMWLRWTLPRPRIDQVLYACVKVLLPMSCALLLGAAVWQWLLPERAFAIAASRGAGVSRFNPWLYSNPWNLLEWHRAGFSAAIATQVVLSGISVSAVLMLLAWIGKAAFEARRVRKRLTDPEPIDKSPRGRTSSVA